MHLDEIKGRCQTHFTDGLLTIVGSGLSCAEGLPSMSELADHLSEAIDTLHDSTVCQEWTLLESKIRLNGLEQALLDQAPSPRLEEFISKEVSSLIVAREKKVISEVFNGSRILRMTRLVNQLLKPSTGLPIVTTNYDRLIEIAVEQAGLGADTMFHGRFSGQLNDRETRMSFCRKVSLRHNQVSYQWAPRAAVYKPHGSLDWYLQNDLPVNCMYDLPDATRLIITPGNNKFRNGYSSPFDHHRGKANDEIDRATRFLIIGYGFNDDHLETHLSPAIKSGKPTMLITKSLSKKAKEWAINYPNVMALEQHTSEAANTNVIVDQTIYEFPAVNLWDINSFLHEVFHT